MFNPLQHVDLVCHHGYSTQPYLTFLHYFGYSKLPEAAVCSFELIAYLGSNTMDRSQFMLDMCQALMSKKINVFKGNRLGFGNF